MSTPPVGQIVEREAERALPEHDRRCLVAGIARRADLAAQTLAAAGRRVDVDVEEAALARLLVRSLAGVGEDAIEQLARTRRRKAREDAGNAARDAGGLREAERPPPVSISSR